MSKRVYVGNLSSRTSEKDLQEAFKKYGNIVKIDLKAGFGFVEYEDQRDASDAVKELNGTDLLGRNMRVEHSKGQPRAQGEFSDRRERRGGSYDRRDRGPRVRSGPPTHSDNRIIIDNLPSGASWQNLKDHFRKIGDVVFADVKEGHKGKYGIVEFKYYDDVKRAIRKLDNTDFMGGPIYISEVRYKRLTTHNVRIVLAVAVAEVEAAIATAHTAEEDLLLPAKDVLPLPDAALAPLAIEANPLASKRVATRNPPASLLNLPSVTASLPVQPITRPATTNLLAPHLLEAMLNPRKTKLIMFQFPALYLIRPS
jgi:arginine/serine-rich splicing factor 4/5/6